MQNLKHDGPEIRQSFRAVFLSLSYLSPWTTTVHVLEPRYRGLSDVESKETPVCSRSLTGGLTVRKNRYPIDHACLLEPFQYGDRNL